VANLLVDIKSSASGSAPSSWGTVPGLSATGITVQGTNSVLLLIAHVQIDDVGDETAEFRFKVNGSVVGSPILTAFADSSSGEVQGLTLVWAIDGLSGSANSFSVEWQIVTGTPIIDTTKPHSFQIIELPGGTAEIKVDQSSSGSATATSSWANLFSASGISIAGTGSILLLLGNVPMEMTGTDEGCDFQFSVDSTREGAITSSWVDNALEGTGWSGIHVKTGISGSHSFELQWQLRQGTPTADTGRLRTFQVVEIKQNAELKINLITKATAALPDSWANINGLSDSYTPSVSNTIALMIGNIQMDDNVNDSSAQFRLAIDGTEEGAYVNSHCDEVNGVARVCLAWAEENLSVASHTFSVQGDRLQNTPNCDPDRERSLFVIELTAAIYLVPSGIASGEAHGATTVVPTTFKLEGYTKDKNGSVLGSCKCFLFKDNLDNTLTYVGYTLSNASTGAYSFTGIEDGLAQYLVVAWKDDTPHVFDCTDHVLQPTEEE